MAAPLPVPTTRRHLPDERESITKRFVLQTEHGPMKVYVRVSTYGDGQPGEVFVTCAKWGSTLRGLVDSWAIMVSVALQHGVPLQVVTTKFKGRSFEPSGREGELGDGRQATSILDMICTWLDGRFGK